MVGDARDGDEGFGLSGTNLIAVVDDDQSMRDALARLVRSLGHEVAAFSSAQQVLDWERLGRADCLISDLKMPDMCGLELQRALIRLDISLPVIFVTALTAPHLREAALAAGAMAFLIKPFSFENLSDQVARALIR